MILIQEVSKVNNNRQQTIIRISVVSAVVTALVLIASFAWYIHNRVGMVRVEAIVVPADARVTYEHGAIRDGVNYIRPGVHTVSIEREGFDSREYAITVTPTTTTITPTTQPVDDVGEQYLRDNPDENVRYETAGAEQLRIASDRLLEQYPNIPDLPHRHFGLASVYRVSYGGSNADGVPILVIENSSTEGRRDALKWLANNGYDINQIIIVYEDYTSPLVVDRGDE